MKNIRDIFWLAEFLANKELHEEFEEDLFEFEEDFEKEDQTRSEIYADVLLKKA